MTEAADAQRAGPATAERAETFLRLMAETELRRAQDYPGAARPVVPAAQASPPSADQVLDRVRAAGSALAVIGAIDDATAVSVLSGLQTALAARSEIWNIGRYGPSLAPRNTGRPQEPPLPDGPVRAVPVARSLPLGADGKGELRLLTLVVAADRAIVTSAIRDHAPGNRRSGTRVHPSDRFGSLWQVRVTDDRGAAYRAQHNAEGDGLWWSGRLSLSPAPPAGLRWLEITVAPGNDPFRVEIPAEPDATPACRMSPVRRSKPGEQLLDRMAGVMLWRWLVTNTTGDHVLSTLAGVVAALDAAAALMPGSPALARLVALASRLGGALPAELRATIRPAILPETWLSVLADENRADGPRSVAAVAAVLPEIDATRFAIAGLYSTGETVTLHVLAWGQQPRWAAFRSGDELFSWWARDSAGRWHVGRRTRSGFSNGDADMDITFVPPLHPAATSLEIILTGQSAQVTVTVPVDWQAVR